MPIGRTEYLVFILVCPGSKSSPELEREEEACWGHVAACRANSRTVSSRLDPRRAGYLPIEPGSPGVRELNTSSQKVLNPARPSQLSSVYMGSLGSNGETVGH